MTRRVLQLGLGNRGRMWAGIIGGRTDVAHAAAVDPDPAARRWFAERNPHVPVFERLEDGLQAGADFALLVTPPAGHLEQSRLIAMAGLPLLVEKPLAESLTEAAEIVALAEANHLPLTVGLNFRYLPVSQALRTLIAEERFGPIGFGQMSYQRNRDGWRPGLNKYPLTMQHPMMLEQSIHHLDLIRFCYGREVQQVLCRTWNPSWSMYAHDSNVHCLLEMEDGVEVNYLGTWTGGWNELQFQWRTDCRDGVIIQRQLFDDLATAATTDAALAPVPLAHCQAFRDDTAALLTAFLNALATGGAPPCSGRDHLRSLALCHAAIESAETGRAIMVPAFQARHGIT